MIFHQLHLYVINVSLGSEMLLQTFFLTRGKSFSFYFYLNMGKKISLYFFPVFHTLFFIQLKCVSGKSETEFNSNHSPSM